jgi:DNA-binding transcriptional LysR family regulator
MISSDDLAFFAVVAGSRSLAESARKLNITPPAVTQRLRALESKAGVRLVDRSRRQLTLTDEGELVAAHGRTVAHAIDALTEALGDRRKVVKGHLRIGAPLGFGRTYVAPAISRFASEHPGVTVTLDLRDHPRSQTLTSYDVVIHIGAPAPSSQIVKTLAPNRRILCASPDYLANAPAIRAPSDLRAHRCLVVRENDEDVTLWRFGRAREEAVTVRIDPSMSSNDGTIVRDWALAGRGIAMRSEWDVAEDLAAGRLTEILSQWAAPAADVTAMVGARAGRSARITAFLAFLRGELTPCPWRSAG